LSRWLGATGALLAAACSSRSGPATTVTPVVLVLSCDDSAVVQSSLSGPCTAGGLTCQDPADSGLAGCTSASFTASGAGECDLQLTFANGFVYTGSFTFAPQGTALVPSPEVVPVYCAPDDAGSPDATAE
jgi:hypothetical protein